MTCIQQIYDFMNQYITFNMDPYYHNKKQWLRMSVIPQILSLLIFRIFINVKVSNAIYTDITVIKSLSFYPDNKIAVQKLLALFNKKIKNLIT